MIERGGEGGEEGTIGKRREGWGGGARGERGIRDEKEGAHSLGSAQNIHVLLVISKLLAAQHTQAPPVEVVGVGT